MKKNCKIFGGRWISRFEWVCIILVIDFFIDGVVVRLIIIFNVVIEVSYIVWKL